MRMVDLIQKKRDGRILTREEINFAVKGYTSGDIPDYQMSAFLMAIFFQGMNKQEIADLTLAYVNSGETVDLSQVEGIKVDKHSTGGVGDKVSLIIIPLAAYVGIPVAKMSGRGLGHTGGTIDKLEAIKGFKTELSKSEFINNVNTYKMAIVGQSANLTPADKKIYALRDVTATVNSIPLIASSIMSKKIASGADCIVLDVKVGTGAFMKSIAEAEELAKTMVEIGNSLNRKTIAVITNMNQPLGYEIGNANEVKEAIQVLKGEGPEDLTSVALTIASHMGVLSGIFSDYNTAFTQMSSIIKSGGAIDTLKKLVEIQGGSNKVIDDPDQLPQANKSLEVQSIQDGYVNAIDAESIGIAAMLLGAGRKTKEDKIDYAAGITLVKKIGDRVKAGETLCVLHTNFEDVAEAKAMVYKAYSVSENKPDKLNLIYKVIEA